MSERFEIHLETKNLIANNNILSLVNDLKIEINSLHTIESWNYDNEHFLNLDKINAIDTLLECNKIVILEGFLGSTKCGAFISKSDNLHYEYDLWFSIDTIEGLKEDRITGNNRHIYDCIFSLLKKYCNIQNIIFCAMGLEMYISDCSNLSERIINSTGVVRWIVQKECDAKFDFYVEEIKDDLKVYSIYSI